MGPRAGLGPLEREISCLCRKSNPVRPADSLIGSVEWGGVRQSRLGISATNWPIVPAPDDT
jgi:hypothetical protein